ncbi:MAG: hypothetical protein WBD56_07100, partial [Anaerolineales bacterium]
ILTLISISQSSVEWQPKVYDNGQLDSIQSLLYQKLPPLTSQAFFSVYFAKRQTILALDRIIVKREHFIWCNIQIPVDIKVVNLPFS